MESSDQMDPHELEEIMSFVPDGVEYVLSDYLRDVSAAAGSNRVLEAFAGGAHQRSALLAQMRADLRVSPQAASFTSRWMRAQDGGSGLESRLAEMWISETSALVDSVASHAGDCSSPARIMFDQVLTELVDLDNFKRLVKGSAGLMAQLITALTVKLLAATDELRANPNIDPDLGVAESALEIADTLRCCLEEMWNMVSARVKQASPTATVTATAKGKKKTAAAPSNSPTATANSQQGSASLTSARTAAANWSQLLERASAGMCISHEDLWSKISAMEELVKALRVKVK